MSCVTMLQVSFDIFVLGIATKSVSDDTSMKYKMIWKSVGVVDEFCVTCPSTDAVLLFFNPFLRERVKILCCRSSGTALDRNKEVYLRVRPDTV